MANDPLFLDSFDHYTSNDDLLKKWSYINGFLGIASGGRHENCMHFSSLSPGVVRRNLPALTYLELTAGFAVKTATLPGVGWSEICSFADSGATQTRVLMSASGQIGIWINSTKICESAPGLITASIFNHVKVNVAFATGTTGHCSIKLNSVEVCSATGVQTAITTSNANQFAVTSGSAIDMFFDDVWVIDPTVTDESLYGDQIVIYCGANGTGQTNDWTPSAGTNSQNVDDNPPTDASYNSTTDVDAVDLYACQDLPGTVTGVVAIQSVLRLRKDDANPVSVATVVGNGSSSTVGDAISLGQDYGFYLQGWGSNPNNDDANWTPSDVNALQVGPKRTV